MKKWSSVWIGACTGILGGLLGGGAGMICVPLLRRAGNEEKAAHAYSVATVFAACAVSVVVYAICGEISFQESWTYLLGGALAAPIGVFLMKKAKPDLLMKGFALFMIYCGVRVLWNA